MAKLSARSRTIICQMARENNAPMIRNEANEIVPSDLINWEKVTVYLMSDNSILKKRDVRFRSDGKKHSYGIKAFGKLAAGKTAIEFEVIYAKNGYKKENARG